MKKIYLLASVITLLLSTASFAQVGISSATSFTPDTNSILDASSTTKGILLPRVALTSTTTLAPITGTSTAPESLFVYNTSTTGTSPNNVTPGFYFWTGTKWNRVLNTDNEAKPMVFYAPSIALENASPASRLAYIILLRYIIFSGSAITFGRYVYTVLIASIA